MMELIVISIAMDKELRFAIREGGRTVGAGVVNVAANKMAHQIRISLKLTIILC